MVRIPVFLATILTGICALIFDPQTAAAAAKDPIVFEAEHANRLDFPFFLEKDKACSGGLCVVLPQGTWESGKKLPDRAPVLWRFRVDAGGRFKLWFRVKWTDACGNSILYRVDSAPARVVTGSLFHRWCWASGGADVEIASGGHNLEIFGREDGVALDQIAVLSAGDDLPPPRNSALEPTCVPGDETVAQADIFFSLPHGETLSAKYPFLLSHDPPAVVQSELSEAELFTAPDLDVPLTVWIRRNRPGVSLTALDLKVPAHVIFRRPDDGGEALPSPGESKVWITLHSESRESLEEITFDVTCSADMPMASFGSEVSIVADGKAVCRRPFLVTRPLEWTVAGPFEGSDPDKSPPGIAGLDAQQPWKDDLDGRKWIRRPAMEWLGAGGEMDLIRLLGEHEHCNAVACTVVNAPSDGTYKFRIEHDDRIRIAVNGVEAYTDVSCGPAAISGKVAGLPLKAGANVISAKITQNKARWEFRIQPLPDSGVVGVPFDE